MTPAADDPRRLIVYGILATAVCVLSLWVLYLLRQVVLVLYISTILAIGFSPAVRWLEERRFRSERHRLPRWAAILLLYAGGLLVIALVLLAILPPVFRQGAELWTRLPVYGQRLQTTLIDLGLIGPELTFSDLLRNIESPGLAVAGILEAVQGAMGVVGAIVTVVLLPFYLLVEGHALQAGLLRMFAPARRPRVARITEAVTLKVGAWLGGQLLLSLVIGTTTVIGLWILGVPYFYVLGLLAAIGELIPVVGPILAAVPAVFMGWTVSPQLALGVIIFFAAQQFLENNVLVPRIMERQVGVSAVTVLVALLIGTELLGIVGAILAVPSAAIFQVMLQQSFERDPEPEPDAPAA